MQKGTLIGLTVIISIILTGCFQGEQSLEEIDTPKEAVQEKEAISEDVVKNEEEEVVSEPIAEADPVARQLYLMDVNGMVVAQTVELPNPESKEVATQALEYLVKDGPVSSILPNGFQAVLPVGTEILGLNLQDDGVLIVDVSSDFENYEAEDELKILQSITFTMTQFENVEKVKLRIEGHPQSEMPVNGTPIDGGYSRVNGININDTGITDFLNSDVVTMHYPAEHNQNRYYIPVTQHIEAADKDLYGAIVQALIDGPGYNMNVTHVFNPHTLLMDQPHIKDGIVELNFNEAVLKDADQAIISDEVMETLVRTLTEQNMVKGVKVNVENIDQLLNENGEVYSEPVTIQAFMPTEKI